MLENIKYKQKVLFSDNLKRLALLKYNSENSSENEYYTSVNINVHRNHSFEPLMQPMATFLANNALLSQWNVSDYDDTLLFSEMSASADYEIIWLDYDRYNMSSSATDLFNWLFERLKDLRNKSQAAVLIANWAGDSEQCVLFNKKLQDLVEHNNEFSSLFIIDLHLFQQQYKSAFWDERRALMTGTRLSDKACLELSRHMVNRIISCLSGHNIKAIAVDFDNTLYSGIIAEEGLSALQLTPEHRQLQLLLVELQKKGLLLVALSRNEAQDIEELFNYHKDWPLKREHFADWQVNWDNKAMGIMRAAKKLRIATDTFLYLDDNPGELAAVATELPQVRMIYSYDAHETYQSLYHFPALWPLNISHTDQLRTQDIQANYKREQLEQTLSDPAVYMQHLDIKLTFRIAGQEDKDRLFELSRKTNQFNLSLKRLSLSAVDSFLTTPDCIAVTIALQDKLSDSGIIAALFVHYDQIQQALLVDELCISCRAMGRYLEDSIISEVLLKLMQQFEANKIIFDYKKGPRNQPALSWLAHYCGQQKMHSDQGTIVLDLNPDMLQTQIKKYPLTCHWFDKRRLD